MNILSFIEPIRGSEVSCLLDASTGVDLNMFLIPFSLQRHCPSTIVPVVIIIILQTTQTVTLHPDATCEMLILGLELLWSDNSLGNH
jgi:hypothetical protein